MTITAAKRTPFGAYEVTIDGKVWGVPDDMNNQQRRNLAEWETAGGVIEPADSEPVPAPDPRDDEIADLKAKVEALTGRMDKVRDGRCR